MTIFFIIFPLLFSCQLYCSHSSSFIPTHQKSHQKTFQIETILENLSIEQKVGQLFIAYFDGETANQHATQLIEKTHIGGIIYYRWANGLTSPQQVKKLSEGLQELTKKHQELPLFIAIDQEGGKVSRLQEGFTSFPSNESIGNGGDPTQAFEVAKTMGAEIRAVGVNLNFAPVVDINSNPNNPVIGSRSFGKDPELVTEFARHSIEGFFASDIIPCLKHFPGHGDTSVDSHSTLPVVNKSIEDLMKVELYPYKKLVYSAPMIMTAHILFPKIDPINPATLSSTLLIDLLRKQLGYEGVIITDSLMMEGIQEGDDSIGEIAIRAFIAGNDLLLIGGRELNKRKLEEANIDEVISIYHTVLNAVQSGRISEQRLNESIERIISLKKRAGLLNVALEPTSGN